jgi:hypothetical protein
MSKSDSRAGTRGNSWNEIAKGQTVAICSRDVVGTSSSIRRHFLLISFHGTIRKARDIFQKDRRDGSAHEGYGSAAEDCYTS